ncbi:MAG TPA: hypothetical protein VGY98_19710 [Verrucomicrobiae bacterium]|nr:hypothetical protein [Verrucomicrobiae bacterium]
MKNAILLLVSLLTCTVGTSVADQFDILTPRFSGTSEFLHSVAFGNGVYVAVGDHGTILYSTDTVTWIPQASGTTNRLYGVKYGSNGFVAVGGSAPGVPSTILNSADGIVWTRQTSPVTNQLSAVCYGSGRYVAAGSQGLILTSTNAVNWTAINTGAPYNFNGADAGSVSITTGGNHVENIFVVVGDSGTIMTSTDGLGWTVRSSGTFFRLAAVSIYHVYSGMLVAVGDSGTIDTSPDGVTWTVQTSGTENNLCAVANDTLGWFGAAGQGGVFLTALDGTGWSMHGTGVTNDLGGLLYANGNFLATGSSGAIPAGIPWLPRNSDTTQNLASVTYGNGAYVAVGKNIILSSGNGADWTTDFTGNNYTFTGATFGTNLFVSVGSANGLGAILTSSNGLNWVSQNIGATNVPNCVAYGNGVYIAMGSAGIVYRSTDGINWTSSFPSLPFTTTGAITFGANLFVAISGNAIATSPDGLAWTARNSGVSYNLNSVIDGNAMFVAVGQNIISSGTQITTSPDGITWTADNSGGNTDYSITYGDQGFVAPGNEFSTFGNVISTSPDGITWTTRGIGGDISDPQIRSATFGNGSYLVAGDDGIILQSIATNAQAAPLLSGGISNQVYVLKAITQPGYTYRIQISTNLLSWFDGFVFTNTQANSTFIDTGTTNSQCRFYKIKTP